MSQRMLVEVHVGKRYGISRLNCDGAGQVKDVIITMVRKTAANLNMYCLNLHI